MNKSYLIIILFLSVFNAIACDPVCLLPNKLDSRTIIAECKVNRITKNIIDPNVNGAFGLVELVVVKTIYSTQKIDTIYLAKFGLGTACESIGITDSILKSRFKVGQTLTIVGRKVALQNNSGLCFTSNLCCPIVFGSLDYRIEYDFKKFKKLNRLLLEKSNNNIDISKSFRSSKIEDFIDLFWEIENELMVPEMMQAYISLSKIEASKDENKKFSILKELIWSNYISDSFIKNQVIEENKIELLLQEYKVIKSRWAY